MFQLNFVHADLRDDCEAQQAIAQGKNPQAHLARLIDHTLLKPEAGPERYAALCAEAAEYGFRSVCVPPAWLIHARECLKKSQAINTKLCVVVGFPNGYNNTTVKIAETENAVDLSADEIDFVQNVGWVKSGAWDSLLREYAGIVKAAQGRLVKVILETSLLTNHEIARCSELAIEAGVHVIKTSTGFGSRGASQEDLQIISACVDKEKKASGRVFGIKASGGVRTLEDALGFVNAGATRLGASSGVAILKGLVATSDY